MVIHIPGKQIGSIKEQITGLNLFKGSTDSTTVQYSGIKGQDIWDKSSYSIIFSHNFNSYKIINLLQTNVNFLVQMNLFNNKFLQKSSGLD